MTLLLAAGTLAVSILIGRRAQRDLALARQYHLEADRQLESALNALALAYRQRVELLAQVEEFTA